MFLICCSKNFSYIKDSCFEEGKDYVNHNIGNSASETAQECQEICQRNPDCKIWSFLDKICYEKEYKEVVHDKVGAVSGPKYCSK